MLRNRWRSPGGPAEQREDEHGETGDKDDAAAADRGRERENAGGEAEPGPARICRDQSAEHDEPERDEPEPPTGSRQEARQGGQQREGQDPGERHVDAERPARAVAAMVEPGRRACVPCRARADGDLEEPDRRRDRRYHRESREEALGVAGVGEGIGGHVESRHQEQAFARQEARAHVTRQERRQERGAGKGQHGSPERPSRAAPFRGIAEPPEPECSEGGERRLRQRDREPETDDEGREKDAPEPCHLSTRSARTRSAPPSSR